MKNILFLALFLSFTVPAFAQNVADATIVIRRQSAVSQAAANQNLSRDIERFMLERYSGINGATPKVDGVCQSFGVTETRADGTTRFIDLDIYNRNADTCLPALNNGKTDLRSVGVLGNILQRAFRLLFDEITDSRYAKDAADAAAAVTKTELSTRTAEKP